MSLLLDRAWILGKIPHKDGMCLNDRVESWNMDRLCCLSYSHLDPDNPLRTAGRLSALIGVEYAAQAVAIHGALLGASSEPGLLGSVRNLVCECAWLDDVPGPLQVDVEKFSGDGSGLLYGFRISGSGRRLLSGRLSIILGRFSEG